MQNTTLCRPSIHITKFCSVKCKKKKMKKDCIMQLPLAVNNFSVFNRAKYDPITPHLFIASSLVCINRVSDDLTSLQKVV